MSQLQKTKKKYSIVICWDVKEHHSESKGYSSVVMITSLTLLFVSAQRMMYLFVLMQHNFTQGTKFAAVSFVIQYASPEAALVNLEICVHVVYFFLRIR